MVCAEHTMSSEIVLDEVTWAMWNLVYVNLQIVLVWTQDWCKVCAKRTIGSEIILHAPDGTPR
jgi:hypothetical protein